MVSRPSDGFTFDELREEFDWICEFQSRMAERISGNPDVHNHVDYVNQLERENAKLRELMRELYEDQCDECDEWKYRDRLRELGIEVDE